MIIIGSFVSPYVRKVLACLNLKGIEYRVDPITPFYGNDEFERLSPLRRIPVLIDGDLAISDSSVIAAYLDEAYGRPPLLPAGPADRARARWFEEYADSRLGDVIVWSYFYQKIVHPLVWGEPGDAGRIADAESRAIPAECAFLEDRLPDTGFLFGAIGLADLAIASFFRNAAYAGFTPDPERWPRLAAFVGRVLDDPSMASLLPFEDVQRNAAIPRRRDALIAAGAPLSERSWGTREPRPSRNRL